MNHPSKSGPDTDLRSMLKHQHKKVYSICRLFAHSYKEHQRLFTDIIAAASQNIRSRIGSGNKETLLLQACINMAALHSISLDLESKSDRSIQFKSPDYQRSMTEFRCSIQGASDYEKFRLFLEFEKAPVGGLASLTGIPDHHSGLGQKKETKKTEKEILKKNFIPYLKEKLIWS
jgi:hypothetical protein